MTWFKVDDAFHSHPKVLATPPAALGLWVVAGAWSSANLTDGFVPDHVLPRLLEDAAKLARNLVTTGLWRKVRGGYQFHDWTAYNPTSNDVRALRERRAEAGRKGGMASRKTRSKPQANASAIAKQTVEPPTRPDPPPSKGRGGGGAAASRPAAAAPSARHSPSCPYPDRNPDTCPVCQSERKAGLVDQELPWPPDDPLHRHAAAATATPPTAPTPTDPPADASSAPPNAKANPNPPPPLPGPSSTTGQPRSRRNHPPSAQEQPSPPAPNASPPSTTQPTTPAATEGDQAA